MQKHVNLVDLVKSFPTNIYLQNLASMQKRTSSIKFAHLAEKSGKGSISNLSTKVPEPEVGPPHAGTFVRCCMLRIAGCGVSMRPVAPFPNLIFHKVLFHVLAPAWLL